MSEPVVSNFQLVDQPLTASGKPNHAKAVCSVTVDGFTISRVMVIHRHDGEPPFITLPKGRDQLSGQWISVFVDNDAQRWRAISRAVLDYYAIAKPRRSQPATASGGEHVSVKCHAGPAWGNAY